MGWWRLKGVARTCLAWHAHGIRMPRMLFHHPAEYLWGQEKATERQGTWLIGEEDSWQLEKDRRSLPPHVERFTIPTYARLDLNHTSQNIATLDRWLGTIGINRIWWSMNLKNIAKKAVPMVKQKVALLTMANFKKWKPTAGSQMGTLSSVPQGGGGRDCPYLVQGMKFYRCHERNSMLMMMWFSWL